MGRFCLFLCVSSIALLFSCGSGEGDDISEPLQIQVYLTDTPGDYEEVNIDIQGVQVNVGDGDGGWRELSANSGIYNLLDLTNGVSVLLADDEIPEGKIKQMRLILGPLNTVVVEGTRYPLTIPSGATSGLKIKINDDFLEGSEYNITLDFDASKSIVQAGASRIFLLKPVIRTIKQSESGSISGIVSPGNVNAAITAIRYVDSIGTYTDSRGHFLIQSLKPGIYNVVIEPPRQYDPVHLEEVVVEVNQTTRLDTINLD